MLECIGRELVQNQSKNDCGLFRAENPIINLERETAKIVGSKLHHQYVMHEGALPIGLGYEVVCGTERPQASIDLCPNFLMAAQFWPDNRIDSRKLVLHPMTKFADDGFAMMLLFVQAPQQASVMTGYENCSGESTGIYRQVDDICDSLEPQRVSRWDDDDEDENDGKDEGENSCFNSRN